MQVSCRAGLCWNYQKQRLEGKGVSECGLLRELLTWVPVMSVRTFDVNTMGPFWTLKSFLPGVLSNGQGHIVNIASLLGTMGVAGCSKSRHVEVSC